MPSAELSESFPLFLVLPSGHNSDGPVGPVCPVGPVGPFTPLSISTGLVILSITTPTAV